MTTIENIYAIEATKKTPSVHFDINAGELRIMGKSLPEYAYAFYGNILDEIDDYIEIATELTTINFRLEYLNTVSSKIIMQLILKFEKLLKIGKEVKIFWYYNDEDDMMFEVGDVLKSSTKIPVQLLKTME
jgi:hypothetical protein